MTNLPEFLKLMNPEARIIRFDEIRKGDTVGWIRREGAVLSTLGIATTKRVDGATWASEDGYAVAWNDETNVLLHRPAKQLPTQHGDMIRLAKPLPGHTSMVYAKGKWQDDWHPIGFGGMSKRSADFADAEWEQVFLTEVNPND